jgi:hypothetical protein
VEDDGVGWQGDVYEVTMGVVLRVRSHKQGQQVLGQNIKDGPKWLSSWA